MAIEKMKMVDMIGPIGELQKVAKEIVLSGNMQVVNTMQEINRTNFKLSATEENVEKLIDVCYIKPYSKTVDYSGVQRELKKLKDAIHFKGDKELTREQLIFDFPSIEAEIGKLSDEISPIIKAMEEKRNEKNSAFDSLEHLKFLSGLNIELSKMESLTNFVFELYRISDENLLKLRSNYENTPSIVLDGIYKEKNNEIILAFTPILMKTEADRFFKSLNCELLDLPEGNQGTAEDVRKLLSQRVISLEAEINTFECKLKEIFKDNSTKFQLIEKSMELETKASSVMENSACTKEFFYLSGWVPESELTNFMGNLKELEENLIIMVKESSAVEEVIPPTKLKNNSFVKPFESMVNMYGIPSYNELDPTTFLGISYMLLFGIMFGDLGQGLIFIFAGLFLKYKKSRPNLGGVLARLGVSSSIFGVVYGSFFGFEEILPEIGIKPLIRPMERINNILLYAIIFGVILLLIGYVYGLINAYRRKDIENGIFGKDGVVGLLFYILVLTFLILKFTGKSTLMPDGIWYAILIILLALTVLKQPLANYVQGKRPLYEESVGDYYVEGGFGILETLLSMFSNTVSFVRVGAFALNHVGLFMAFAALAKMMNSGFGGAIMYVLGNIIIIGLEGLIVFIQGLRLEYYELFSKYYEGAGIAFEPIRMSSFGRLNLEKKIVNKINNVVVNE